MPNDHETEHSSQTDKTGPSPDMKTIRDIPQDDAGETDAIKDAHAASDAEMGASHEETELALADRLVLIEQEKTQIKDQLLRSLAEQDNLRKRSERKIADERVYAVEKFARDMLSVADNLARALTALNEQARTDLSPAGKSLLEGIELTEKELIATLTRHGVRTIDSLPGTEFDPNVHQAVAQIPSEEAEGTIAEPFQTGWKLGERTLRAAMVAVSTGPAN